MAVVGDPFYQRHVIGKRQVRSVDHCRAHACLHFLGDVVERFVMIEMDRQRLVMRFCQIARDSHDIADPGIAEGARRSGNDQRRAQLGGSLDNNLQRFEIMNIESWNRVTFSLSLREHRFGRNDVHSSSETFRLFSSKEDIVFRNAFL